MALKDNDTKPLKQILASLTFREKIEYLWEYYKWVPIVAVAAIFFVVSMASGIAENRKELLIGGMTINLLLDEETEPILKDDLFTHLGGSDPSRQKVELLSSVLLDADESGDTSSAYAVEMQLTTQIASGALDYILMDPVGKDFLAGQVLTTNPEELFSGEYLEKIRHRLVYRENSDGQQEAFALDLSDTPLAAACGLEKFGMYIAFPGNTERNHRLEALVDYLLNWQ